MKEQQENPVLFADDEENDRRLFQMAATESNWRNPVLQFEDGEGLIAYLKNPGNKRPALVVLDVKMRKIGGFDVLSWLRARRKYDSVPAILLSSSGLENDLRHAFSLGATAYCVKPVRYTEFLTMVTNMRKRWLDRSDVNAGPCKYLSAPSAAYADRGCVFPRV